MIETHKDTEESFSIQDFQDVRDMSIALCSVVLGIFLFIGMMDGYVDAKGGTPGTSVIAKFYQNIPSYYLSYLLNRPANWDDDSYNLDLVQAKKYGLVNVTDYDNDHQIVNINYCKHVYMHKNNTSGPHGWSIREEYFKC
jgi:hypothetical protein